MTPAKGAEVARVVLLPDGSGYLKSDRMAQLDAGHTYQLWALTGTAAHPVAISAGVLGSAPLAVEFQTATDVHGFAITVERARRRPVVAQSPISSATCGDRRIVVTADGSARATMGCALRRLRPHPVLRVAV